MLRADCREVVVAGCMQPNTNTALALPCDGACNRLPIKSTEFNEN